MSNLKLPHWAQLAVALAIVIVTWVVQQTNSGSIVLPAAAVSGLTLLLTILGILSPSSNPATNAKAVTAAQNATNAVAKAAASLTPPAMLLLVLCLAAPTMGCGAQLTPQTVAEVNAIDATLLCSFNVYATDAAKTPPASIEQTALDLGVTCGPTLAQVIMAFGASSPIVAAYEKDLKAGTVKSHAPPALPAAPAAAAAAGK